MLHQQINIKEYINQSINNLPEDSLYEILNFVIYIRKKVYQPELFNLDTNIINDELKSKTSHEINHLESEFENYKTIYPHE